MTGRLYYIQTNNKYVFLSLDFGLREFAPSGIRSSVTSEFHGASVKNEKERLQLYRRFVYEKGGIGVGRVESLEAVKQKENKRVDDFEIGAIEKFKYRSRYFTDSGIIGTKAFVARHYQAFKHHFSSKHEKQPKTIRGLNGIYSLKRLSEKA